MKVTVVGYWGGFPKAKEATSGYLFEEDGFKLLVDCGSGVLSQLQSYIEVDQLDAVVLSHYHHDHVADIGPLQFARLVTSQTKGKLPELPIYGHRFNESEFKRLSYKDFTKGVEYNPAFPIEVGPFTISFLQTKHPVPCYAMAIQGNNRKAVFTADSSYQESFIPFSQSADLLICECNLYKGMDGSNIGHMTSEEAGRLATDAGVGHLILSHLPHFGEVEQLVSEAKEHYNGTVELASSGLIWEKE